MKKFSIKSLLVLVLALVLVLSLVLVACNKEEEPEPEKYTAKEYFAKLWDLSKGIGNQEVKNTDNVAVSADLGVQVEVSDTKKLGIGIALDLVLDRHDRVTKNNKGEYVFAGSDNTGVSKATAVRIKLYDGMSATKENWVTLYYFFGDAQNLYIDFAGQQIKFAFDYANNTLGGYLSQFIFDQENTVKYKNTEYLEDENGNYKFVQEYVKMTTDEQKAYKGQKYTLKDGEYKKSTRGEYRLDEKYVELTDEEKKTYDETRYSPKNGMSIGEIVSLFADSTGSEWTLNGLFDAVLQLVNKALGMDISGLVGKVAKILGVNQDKVYVNNNGNMQLNILALLASPKLEGFFVTSMPSTQDGVTTYRTRPSATLMNLVAGQVALLKDSTLDIELREKDGVFQQFAINAKLPALKVGADVPSVTVAINSLKISGVEQDKTETFMGMDADKRNAYKTDVALDAKLALDIDGISIKPSALEGRNEKLADIEDIKLDGQLIVDLKGVLDVLNKKDINKSEVNASVSYKAAGATTAVPFLQASFIRDTLAVKLNKELTFNTVDGGEVKVADAIVGAFGGYVYDWAKSEFFKDAAGQAVLDKFAEEFFVTKTDGTLDYFALNSEFKGAVWKNITIVKNFQDIVNKLVKMMNGNPLVDTDAKTTAVSIDQISATIKKVIAVMSSCGTDGLVIDVDNINKVVANIGSDYGDKNMTEDGNVVSITKWDNGNWITDIAKLLVIAGSTYGSSDVQKGIEVTKKDIEMYKNAERERYALAYYDVTEARIAAARNDYKGKSDDQIRIALAGEDFKAYATISHIKEVKIKEERAQYKDEVVAYIADKDNKIVTDEEVKEAKEKAEYAGMLDEQIRESLAVDKYDKMSAGDIDNILVNKLTTITLKYIGKTDAELAPVLQEDYKQLIELIDAAILQGKEDGKFGITAIRFIGKTDDDIIALVRADKAFIAEVMAASAKVKLALSGKDGIALSVNVALKDAKVGVSLTIGAHEVGKDETFANYGKDIKSDSKGWFYHEF